MKRIKVKNVGPIKEGYLEGDGFLDIPKVTVFIGAQATGKSTLAKLISTYSWIEKALYRGDFGIEVLRYDPFPHFRYQNLSEFFSARGTQLSYQGDFLEAGLRIQRTPLTKGVEEIHDDYHANTSESGIYLMPKIMYVPAERNFLSIASEPDKVKGLPLPLFTFFEEFFAALEFIRGFDYQLPLEGLKVLPIDGIQSPIIRGHDYSIKLSYASSGVQSLTPLMLVTHYLSSIVADKASAGSKSELSLEERARLKQEIEVILKNPALSFEVRAAMIANLSQRTANSCFLNIVEEPEQNLFPESQQAVLHQLLAAANKSEGNQLIMTTHSPYIVNYLSIAIKAGEVWRKLRASGKGDSQRAALEALVPEASSVLPEEVAIYETHKDGTITRLPTVLGIPSDDNFLNKSLQEGNQIFDQLLEIEDQL